MIDMKSHSEGKIRARLSQYLDSAGYGAQTGFADHSKVRREMINRFLKGGGVTTSTLDRIDKALDSIGAPTIAPVEIRDPWDLLADELERVALYIRDNERDDRDRMEWLKVQLKLLNYSAEKIEKEIKREN